MQRIIFLFSLCFLVITGCASTSNLKGLTPGGEKVYLGPVPIESTESFKSFKQSAQTEVNIQQYLFQRLKEASPELRYFHDGNWYNWLEAYRGGMWLVRNRYQKGQNTRDFLKKYVWRSESTNQLHLIRYPDGTTQVAYFVLLNELDLLEKTLKS